MRNRLTKRMGLNAQELDEIRELADIVNAHDGIEMKLNWEMLRERPPQLINDLLYYADGRLAAFLGIYFLMPGESELSGMVHPDYRRQGIFSKMADEALGMLPRRGTKVVIHICPRGSDSGAAFLKSRGVHYSFSEYVMERKVEDAAELPAGPNAASIRLREAELPHDVPLLAELNHVGFGVPLNDAEEIVRRQTSCEVTFIVETPDHVAMGKLGVQLEGGSAFIFGFCVRPAARGQGIGRTALAETIRLLQQERGCRHFLLEVEVDNEKALGLYESVGFRRINIMDYYKQQVPVPK